MPAVPFDSAIYRDLLGDREIARLFTDAAEVRSMLLVEGALAKAQAAEGLIPELAAEAIHRASLEVQIEPAALAAGAGRDGVAVPALVEAFRDALAGTDHANYLHWGCTSQDIADTALVLRLRQILAILDTRLAGTVRALGRLAEAHADLPMAGRTYGQTAVPTSFGAVAAGWGAPLLRHHRKLEAVRADALRVSLGGAAGTLSAMGGKGPAVRAGLAAGLNLADPGASWHAERDGIAALAAWLTAVAAACGKIGEDLILMTQTGIGEVRLGAVGSSSAMPQKANPVGPSLVSALARFAAGLNATLQFAPVHRQQRDGAAWFSEWLVLPQLCLAAGRSLLTIGNLAKTLEPVPEAMADNLAAENGAVFAEALNLELARRMPRTEAKAMTVELIARARARDAPLADIALEAYPELDRALFEAGRQLGEAPAKARSFAGAALSLPAPADPYSEEPE